MSEDFSHDLVSFRTQPRCYVSRNPKITRVCHHCGRAMSRFAGPFTVPDGIFGRLYENLEFSGLDLEEITPTNQGIHCEHCLHYNYSFLLVCLFVILAFVGGMLWAATLTPPLVRSPGILIVRTLLILLSVFLVFCAVWQATNLRLIRLHNRPLFPLIGRNPHVTVIEKVRGNILLDADGIYSAKIKDIVGQLAYTLRLTPTDMDRFEAYRKKFKLSRQTVYDYHAGFLLFRSAVGLRFEAYDAIQRNRVNTLSLEERAVPEQLDQIAQRRHWQWQSDYSYRISHFSEQENRLPVQIIPTIVSERESQALELTLQVDCELSGEAGPENLPEVQELILRAPASLGHVEVKNPSNMQFIQRGDNVEIRWSGVELNQGDRNVYYRPFYLQFTNPVESEMQFEGRFWIRLEGTLSGIENVQLYYPLGSPRDVDKEFVDQFTDIVVDFKISLQQVYTHRPYPETPKALVEPVIPDYKMINQLIDALSSNGVYVQRVIENPPRTNRANASRLNRLWDIAGRYYYGVYPIDFHLVLRGYEDYTDSDRPNTGETTFEIAIHATITDESVEEKVKRFQEQLEDIVHQTVEDSS